VMIVAKRNLHDKEMQEGKMQLIYCQAKLPKTIWITSDMNAGDATILRFVSDTCLVTSVSNWIQIIRREGM